MDTSPANLPIQCHSSIDVIKDEKISYSSSVTFNSKTLEEIPFYTREFTTLKNYKLCNIDLCIPMTGSDTANHRARILLYLDDEMIFDATCYDPINWNLKCLVISAKKINLLAGFHRMKILGCVDGGTFQIPHFNLNCIENTISPKISGKLCIIGQN